MAAAEYYYGTAGAQELQRRALGAPQAPRPPYPDQHPPYLQPQSSYLQQQQEQQRWLNGMSPAPATASPAPHSSLQAYQPQPTPQRNGYLNAPIYPTRSHSQPPRVHFADDYESDSSSDSDPSDSDSSRRRRSSRRRHSHSRSRHHHHHGRRSRSSSLDRDSDERRGHRRSREKQHRERDTFLGAGAGGLIGDVIFPGLGTAAGLLLGGYGGRKHAQTRKRSSSETTSDRQRFRSRSGGADGWDEGSATFKKGHAVR